MATKWPQGEITPNQPATVLGGNNISGVYTLDQLNRLNADFGPQMQRSLRFRSSASAYLNRTPASAGNQQIWTWSGWIKKGNLTVFEHLFGAASSVSNRFSFNFDNSVASGTNGDYLCAFIVLGGTTTNLFQTNALFRDPSAWYHVVLAVDTTQATSTNRLKLYVNGNLQTFSTYNAPAQNTAMLVNSAIAHNIASGAYSAGTYTFDGYMADINFIDGQALDPSYFGKYNGTTGVWQPIFYTGSYGTNGFRLTFANTTSTTTLGYDSSPNGNNWTPNNISLTAGSTYDSMLDVPTNWTSGNPIQARGNYAVMNPLDTSGSTTNANLSVSTAGFSGYGTTRATFGMSSGKWYWEVTPTSFGDGGTIGIATAAAAISSQLGANAYGWGYLNGGSKYTNASATAYGASYTTNDVIGVAFDADAGTLTFYKNNTSQGIAFSGLTSGPYFPTVSDNGGGTTGSVLAVNFGQRPFAYTPPTGFISLCTQNLSQPTVFNGANHMAATLYTGTGATQSISNIVNGVSFQPDFVWVKSRSAATDHALYDVIRGTQNRLESNTTDAAVASDNGLTAFGTSGFTVNTLAQVNTNAATYVGWQWKANGTAVTNNAGSISSQVSANTTAGFSVVTWTGTGASAATIGHGLGVAPNFVFLKQRNGSTYGWVAYHSALGAGSYLVLNQTVAGTADTAMFNNTAPTSSVFTLSSGGNIVITNPSSGTMVAYCFAAIAGYSAFGSYTGNGSSDGPFVFTGFRPRFVLIKGTVANTGWAIWDSSRGTYNVNIPLLEANSSSAEFNSSSYQLDFLSNGLKIRSSNSYMNGSGDTYIYAAFAENPFKYSLAR